MTEAAVYIDNQTGLVISPGVYLQFEDDEDTAVSFTEGTGNKLRRYVVTVQDLVDAELPSGNWFPTVRLGDVNNRTSSDEIKAVIPVSWNGLDLINKNSGGGILSARIGIGSLTPDEFFEVIQGEEKTITFIVEAKGRFHQANADEITVKVSDGTTETILKTEEDGSIERVCEALDVQVIRCTLSPENTAALVNGIMEIEIAFDLQKVRLSNALKIIEQIEDEGT